MFKLVKRLKPEKKHSNKVLWNLPSTQPGMFIRVVENGEHIAAYQLRKKLNYMKEIRRTS